MEEWLQPWVYNSIMDRLETFKSLLLAGCAISAEQEYKLEKILDASCEDPCAVILTTCILSSGEPGLFHKCWELHESAQAFITLQREEGQYRSMQSKTLSCLQRLTRQRLHSNFV